MTNAEIQVGEYVRTKEGLIRKILQSDYIEEYKAYRYKVDKDVSIKFNIIWQRDIRKHSFNIIDLIEVGDYVNGLDINFIDRDKREVYHDAHDILDTWCFRNNEIQTIVTKERFKAMEYEVGG